MNLDHDTSQFQNFSVFLEILIFNIGKNPRYGTHLTLFAKSNEATKASPGRYIIKSKAVFLICTVLITSPCRTAQRRKMSVNGNVLVHVCTSSHAHTQTRSGCSKLGAHGWTHAPSVIEQKRKIRPVGVTLDPVSRRFKTVDFSSYTRYVPL